MRVVMRPTNLAESSYRRTFPPHIFTAHHHRTSLQLLPRRTSAMPRPSAKLLAATPGSSNR